MKTKILSLASLFTAMVLSGEVCIAQSPQPPPTSLPNAFPPKPQPSGVPPGVPVMQPGVPRTAGLAEPSRREEAPLFDLEFGGGTPQQLVAAIEKATGEPLNAIIPEQDKDVLLPALRMRQVTVSDLFAAMEQSSRRTEMYVTGTYYSGFAGSQAQYSQQNTSFGFRKVGTVWVFSNNKVTPPPDLVSVKTRFYQLEPYLVGNAVRPGNTVEDITTAIQTAWKMMENKQVRKNATTELKFHKETGLLIAVGDAVQVQMIDDVLSALRPDLATGLPPAEPRKTNAPAKKQATEN